MPNHTKVDRLTASAAGLGHKASFADPFPVRNSGRSVSLKAVMEFGLALFLTVLAAPVIAILALLVKLTSPGPALYSQTRLGRNGRPYSIHKLRTMVHNCERLSGPCWSTAGD